MYTRCFLLHALSPVHAGTGQAVDIIDLPIARMRSTGIPIVPGSSIKGVLRDARRDELEEALLFAVFGPNTKNASDHAGAVAVSDARLLALPVRSFRGTFAWVTSPLLLQLASRDLIEGGARAPEVAQVSGPGALVGSSESVNVHRANGRDLVFLEDLDLTVATGVAAEWADFLGSRVYPERPEVLAKRLVVVDDETMTYLWETATQIDTRVRISEATRTVAPGALWTEESLPPETLLIALLSADRSRKAGQALTREQVADRALGEDGATLQFGGKATVGRGRCRLIPIR